MKGQASSVPPPWRDVVYDRTNGYPETSDFQSWVEDPKETPVVRLDTPLSFSLDAWVLPALRSGNVEKGFTEKLHWKKKTLHLVVPRTPWTSHLLNLILDANYVRGVLNAEYWEAFRAFQKTLTRQEKWILHAVTNMSHFHLLPYLRTGHLPPSFLTKVPTWIRNPKKQGFFPFAPLLLPTTSLNATSYHALLQRFASISSVSSRQELEASCNEWSRRLDDLFSRCPTLHEPMVVFRGLKTLLGGDLHHEPAYTSTTLSFFRALQYKSKKNHDPCCVQRITIPAGMPVFFLEGVSSFRGEWEILLPRNLTFRVHHRHLVRVPSTENEWKSHPPRRFDKIEFQETSVARATSSTHHEPFLF